MNDLLLPILAGSRLLFINPYHCDGTALFQIGLVLWIGFLAGRLILSAVAARIAISTLTPFCIDKKGAATAEIARAQSAGICFLQAGATTPPIATVGFFSPKILIAPALLKCLNSREISAITTHELAHVQRRDTIRTALMSSGGSLAFLICTLGLVLYSAFPAHLFRLDRTLAGVLSVPLAGVLIAVFYGIEAFVRYRSEIACDAAACREVGGEAVASALIKVARAGMRARGVLGGSVVSFGESRGLKSRVRRALQFSANSRTLVGARMFWMATVAAGLLIAYESAVLRQLNAGVDVSGCSVCHLLSYEARKATKEPFAPSSGSR